jgi:hypothetical protein
MDKLTITATLNTPVVSGGGYWTLDAILAAAIYDQCNDLEQAHSTVPLRNTHGLFHASAAIMEPIDSGRISFVANMRADHALDPDLIMKSKDGKRLHTSVGRTRRRDFGAVMNHYGMVTVPEVTWFAEGDGEAIQRLLKDVHFIGKRRASGFGEVTGWTVEPGELDGVVGVMGEPLRPVPLELFTGDPDSLKVDTAWKPAYWHPAHRAICYAPEAR